MSNLNDGIFVERRNEHQAGQCDIPFDGLVPKDALFVIASISDTLLATSRHLSEELIMQILGRLRAETFTAPLDLDSASVIDPQLQRMMQRLSASKAKAIVVFGRSMVLQTCDNLIEAGMQFSASWRIPVRVFRQLNSGVYPDADTQVQYISPQPEGSNILLQLLRQAKMMHQMGTLSDAEFAQVTEQILSSKAPMSYS